jgi:hypothetical protein
MLKWLDRGKRSEQWQDRTKIPHPATWLNQRRWEADPPPEGKTQKDKTIFEAVV